MKFLVINRHTGHDVAHEHLQHEDPGVVKERKDKALAQLKEFIKDGTLEVCYSLISGGHAYVINAATTEELATKVRYNPLFKKTETEIIPIADAVEFIEGAREHKEKLGL